MGALIVISVLWVLGYMSYVDHHRRTNPRITWGVPWTEWYLLPSKGALIWEERLIRSPYAGPVTYPRGEGPIKVPAGAVVATVNGVPVKTPVQGIFTARLDQMEGKWRYQYLWDNRDNLPAPPPPKPPKRSASPGEPIGKVVEQPQEIRFLGYVDMVGTVPQALKERRLPVRKDRFDMNLFGEVRFYEVMGPKALVYMDLPWVTEDIITQRTLNILVEAGRFDGVAVPESSVVQRNGSYGVYVVRGNVASFRPVEGRPVGSQRFLVTKGLAMGEAVIVDGRLAREGRVQLW
ncbi:hypothetical protein TheveDRAFT_0498 [Thermanaerovibrio velox DSM 12556]|uniref:Membrane-fusion protein n=1 Tax=Thermanaerovibrio velox DSM 12556 TaxID=926567 RepID=H0UQ30_9BACT|nr:efflux RND transporter periplasmic adaptor subunit [Thermanaerovibrio velox]EHM09659.1 hypothetical protein TheveDRAFT_0498 [Thermanaerovibrio velox DSM 12556]